VSRERLPNRRNAEVLDFVHLGRRWTATIGRFPDGRAAELFLDVAKVDPLSQLAQDVAIVASIAPQSGCPLSTVRYALAGRGEGPLSAALELIRG
jgi:ribonucleoside-diphosphate reductase alpha chain